MRTQIFCTVNACSISVKSLKVLALSPFFLIYLFVVTNSRWGLTLSIFFVVSEQKTFISQKLHQPNKRFFFLNLQLICYICVQSTSTMRINTYKIGKRNWVTKTLKENNFTLHWIILIRKHSILLIVCWHLKMFLYFLVQMTCVKIHTVVMKNSGVLKICVCKLLSVTCSCLPHSYLFEIYELIQTMTIIYKVKDLLSQANQWVMINWKIKILEGLVTYALHKLVMFAC